MSEQKANVQSYIKRLRKPGGVPPFIQREVADILEYNQNRLAKLQSKALAVLDSWENGNVDADLDGNILELAEVLDRYEETRQT